MEIPSLPLLLQSLIPCLNINNRWMPIDNFTLRKLGFSLQFNSTFSFSVQNLRQSYNLVIQFEFGLFVSLMTLLSSQIILFIQSAIFLSYLQSSDDTTVHHLGRIQQGVISSGSQTGSCRVLKPLFCLARMLMV